MEAGSRGRDSSGRCRTEARHGVDCCNTQKSTLLNNMACKQQNKLTSAYTQHGMEHILISYLVDRTILKTKGNSIPPIHRSEE